MELYNVNEDIPEYFYVFLSFANNIIGQMNYNNFNLSKKIVSSGFHKNMVGI